MNQLAKALKKMNKFDELNEKGYVRVSGSKQPLEFDTKPVLVKGNAPLIEDRTYTRVSAQSPEARKLEAHSSPAEIDSQGLKRAFRSGSDTMGKFRGGKLGALAAAATLGYQALKGEPVMAQDVIKSGAELLNPLPFSLDEIKQETDKMDYTKKLAKMQADKELERTLNEERARPGALEFGKYLKAMQKK